MSQLQIFKILQRRGLFIVGLSVILLMIAIAIFAPFVAQQDPTTMSLVDRFQAPSSAHVFGLDQNGSDVFAQVIYGARVSLYVSLVVVSVSVLLGLSIGSVAGYFGGWIDILIMRFLDMLYAFPGFLLALSLVAVLGPSVNNLIIAMCVTSWTAYARLVRGEILHLKTRDYVVAAQALGAGHLRILCLHIWPNLLSLLVVQASFGMAGAILTESGLSFLGLGAPSNVPTWGALLNAGRRVLIEAPHVSIFAGIAIFVMVFGFNLVADGLRDILNPKRNA